MAVPRLWSHACTNIPAPSETPRNRYHSAVDERAHLTRWESSLEHTEVVKNLYDQPSIVKTLPRLYHKYPWIKPEVAKKCWKTSAAAKVQHVSPSIPRRNSWARSRIRANGFLCGSRTALVPLDVLWNDGARAQLQWKCWSDIKFLGPLWKWNEMNL